MKTYLVIDIGGSFIKSALINEDRQLSQKSKYPTPNNMTDFLAVLQKLITDQSRFISGLALACPGEINSKTGFVFHGGLIPYLKNFPLGSYLSKQFSLPTTVINDADAAGLAEARYGVLRNLNCGAILVLGTGVGVSIVSKNTLISLITNNVRTKKPKDRLLDFRNPDSQAWPRIRQLFDIHRRGLENLLTNTGSAVQFVKKASEILNLVDANGQAVFQALETSPSAALKELFENYSQDIAYLILNLQSIFQLEKLAIGGGISSQPSLLTEINRQYEQLILSEKFIQSFPHIPIVASRFHNEANLIGAYCHFQIQSFL